MTAVRAGHHPQCKARYVNANLDRCNCRIPPIVDLTATVTACYQHAEAIREDMHRLRAAGVTVASLPPLVDFLDRLAATLDGSSNQGDEPRPWTGT